MNIPFDKKSTVSEIKERFDADVERFSNIETGQQAVIDAPLKLELISELAVKINPDRERLGNENAGEVRIFEGDFRELELPRSHYDVIVAAAVLHHLRDDTDWENTFRKIYGLLRPGGTFFVSDLVFHENERVHEEMWKRYGAYLERIGGRGYSRKVFDYIDKEDTPRSLTYQIDLMRKLGFGYADVLHKNSCFAAFVGIK
ncbi:MAG: class I SAM-dependent methyltransferase [Thermodesulfobacteriota bacterium]